MATTTMKTISLFDSTDEQCQYVSWNSANSYSDRDQWWTTGSTAPWQYDSFSPGSRYDDLLLSASSPVVYNCRPAITTKLSLGVVNFRQLCCSGYITLAGNVHLVTTQVEHQMWGLWSLSVEWRPSVVWVSRTRFRAETPVDIQGGPAKVRPTYIFDGNIWMHK